MRTIRISEDMHARLESIAEYHRGRTGESVTVEAIAIAFLDCKLGEYETTTRAREVLARAQAEEIGKRRGSCED